jgi:hypothetical protein
MNVEDVAKKLQAPFDPSDIEWKPQTSGIKTDGRAFVLAVPYITNRAIQKRLDDVFGVFGWGNEYKPSPDGKGFLCGITISLDGKSVTKWDGSENTAIEPLKGGLSGSMKRAAVQLGIGRYLYELPEFWAKCVSTDSYSQDGYENLIRKGKKLNKNIAWKNPELPEWARPSIDHDKHNKAISSAADIPELKACFGEAWKAAKVNQDEAAQAAFKILYDSRLSHFEQEAAENIAKDTQEIKTWIDSQKMGLELVPTASACELAYKRLKESLADKCQDTFVDVDSLNERLDSIYTNHIANLQKGEAA